MTIIHSVQRLIIWQFLNWWTTMLAISNCDLARVCASLYNLLSAAPQDCRTSVERDRRAKYWKMQSNLHKNAQYLIRGTIVFNLQPLAVNSSTNSFVWSPEREKKVQTCVPFVNMWLPVGPLIMPSKPSLDSHWHNETRNYRNTTNNVQYFKIWVRSRFLYGFMTRITITTGLPARNGNLIAGWTPFN